MPRPKDETYIIDLCDSILGLRACRGYRGFSFLLGDISKTGRQARLPVDAYYKELKLVVEYNERQHYEDVPIFNRRFTVSGVYRGEQRKKYDLRRATVLPENDITLVILCYYDFEHDARKRLRRTAFDRDIIAMKLNAAVTV